MKSAAAKIPREENAVSMHNGIAPMVAQLRIAIMMGVDREFLANPQLAALEVTAAQFAILKNVLRSNTSSACELCKKMDYDRGAMSRMIDRLESKGLLRRVPLAHTRRSVALEVTPAGQAAFPLMEACLDRVMSGLLRGVTPPQIREFEKTLKLMLENVPCT